MDLKSFLKTLKLQEATISMLFGVVVIILVGYLGIKYFTNKSTQGIIPPIETEEVSSFPKVHIVSEGESLWTIAETYYGTGYNWIDIKDANEVVNANELAEGQQLTIPNVTPRIALEDMSPSPIAQNTTVSVAPSEPETTQGTPSEENSSEPIESTYTVSKNDSLWKIAKDKLGNGDRWVEIAKANELSDPGTIYTGQKLVLSTESKGQITPEAASTSSGETSYTVQSGDSLWSISEASYGDGNKWVQIAQANSLKNPSIIHHGNTLSIPK